MIGSSLPATIPQAATQPRCASERKIVVNAWPPTAPYDPRTSPADEREHITI